MAIRIVGCISTALLLATLACDKQDGGAPSSSAKASASAPASASASAKPTAAASASAAGSASATSAPAAALSAKEFCERVVKLGEDNLAKCASSEKENLPAPNHVKPLSGIPKECSMRVSSANVDFHGDVARRCVDAAGKRGGKTTFYLFATIPECDGVVTGKVAEGKAALFGEECAPGLSFVKGRCVKPVALNGHCDEYPGGLLGKPEEHPRCEPGAACTQTGFGADGTDLVFTCLPLLEIGARCSLKHDQCAAGASCYQGKCRAQEDVGGACMASSDCRGGRLGEWDAPVDGRVACDIKAGVFGKCVAQPAVVDTCGAKPH